jgi:hypothetical protein
VYIKAAENIFGGGREEREKERGEKGRRGRKGGRKRRRGEVLAKQALYPLSQASSPCLFTFLGQSVCLA